LETNNTFNPVLHIIVNGKLSGRGMDKTSPAVTNIQVHLKPYQSTESSKGRRCMTCMFPRTMAIQVSVTVATLFIAQTLLPSSLSDLTPVFDIVDVGFYRKVPCIQLLVCKITSSTRFGYSSQFSDAPPWYIGDLVQVFVVKATAKAVSFAQLLPIAPQCKEPWERETHNTSDAVYMYLLY